MSQTRRAPSTYPLWLAVLAFGGALAAWFAVGAEETTAPPATGLTDAGPPDAATPPPPPETPLTWTVEGRGPLEAASLAACLTDAGYGRALVVGEAAQIITFPGRRRPLRVEPVAGGLVVTTPIDGDARLAAALHVGVTACLYAPDAAVHDPLLDRRLDGAAWPQLGASGGASIEALVAFEPVAGGFATRGLVRLGRPELAVAGDGAPARRLLTEAAAAAVVAALPFERLDLPGGPVRLVAPGAARAAGWWRGPADGVRVLADATADGVRPATPPVRPAERPEHPARTERTERPARTERTERTERPARTTRPATPPERPARPTSPRPTSPRPPPPRPAPGGFRPEYR